MVEYVVGRSNDRADIITPPEHPGVSRAHMRLSIGSDGAVVIEDLGSTGGTFVSRGGRWERVKQAQVTANDWIRLADFQTSVIDLLRAVPAAARPPSTPAQHATPPRYETPAVEQHAAALQAPPSGVAEPYGGPTGETPVQSAIDLELPRLSPNQRIDMRDVRAPGELAYLSIIWAVNGFVALVLAAAVVAQPAIGLAIAFYALVIWVVMWVSFKLVIASIRGHCIEVGPLQYPQIHAVVKQASEFLGIPQPNVYIMQGHGMFELFVAKWFTHRGFLIITSNMIDEFSKKPSSRELMMFVGRQLGHIKAGHFDYWFFKNVIGCLANFFFWAWHRRSHITADRIGLLCAGNLYSAEQALLMITVGAGIAPGTNFDAVIEQRTRVRESFWCWVDRIFSRYPYMVDRLVLLREFAASFGMSPTESAPAALIDTTRKPRIGPIGALPIAHISLRSMPVLVIHGHDRVALLELQNLLYTHFPNVMPRVMVTEQLGTLGMSEKFERLTGDLVGAIALITPDDVAAPLRDVNNQARRARQNVVMEIGWVWGKLGRNKCMLMKRGDIELPSDLSGVDVATFHQSPGERFQELHAFIQHLGTEQQHMA